MKRVLVTGSAGFIGSHLCEALLIRDYEVVGLDAFIPYYPRSFKEANLEISMEFDNFEFHSIDLRTAPLDDLVRDCEIIVHLAAMPGLMRSWSDFKLYSSCNIDATQRLLEAAQKQGVEHFVYGSTSSVYGIEATGSETSELRPYSPYGLTKLAAEHLCRAYEANFGLPVSILRFFSVYGPRQRPDMAYNILIDGLIHSRPFTRFGNGEQTRSNTYISDCVHAIVLTVEKRDVSLGETFNVGGGQVITLNKVIQLLENIVGKKIVIENKPERPGDQKNTQADVSKARNLLEYQPVIPVEEGLLAQVQWMKTRAKV